MGDEHIVIHPKRGRREPALPASGVLLVTPAEARHGHSLQQSAGGRSQFLYNSQLTVAPDGNSFVAGPAIGAPMAAMTMEKLIALGARYVVLFGWCGAVDPELQIGDVVLGATPVSGEGTSGYYVCEKSPMPSPHLLTELASILESTPYRWQNANIWSTDAVYREDRRHLAMLAKSSGVRAVDMEYAALCAVCSLRQIEFAAVFLVSDELYRERWRPGFTSDTFRRQSRHLAELLVAGRFGA